MHDACAGLRQTRCSADAINPASRTLPARATGKDRRYAVAKQGPSVTVGGAAASTPARGLARANGKRFLAARLGVCRSPQLKKTVYARRVYCIFARVLIEVSLVRQAKQRLQ